MLTLKRRINDRIFIGEKEITIEVLDIKHNDKTGGYVSLGISAPNNVLISRSEIYYKKAKSHKENKPPASGDMGQLELFDDEEDNRGNV